MEEFGGRYRGVKLFCLESQENTLWNPLRKTQSLGLSYVGCSVIKRCQKN